MDFALRGYLGPLKTFISEIEKPIQMDRNQQVAERFSPHNRAIFAASAEIGQNHHQRSARKN